MALEPLRLSFYGVRAELRSENAALLEALGRDFEYFHVPQGEKEAEVRWDFHAGPAPDEDIPTGSPLWRARDYSAYDRGSERVVLFDDPAFARWDYRTRSGSLYCSSLERLHELAYLAILSRVGEELDRKGLHRAHALGFERRGRAGLLLLPSGGGKSSLALELLRSTDLGLLSEDTPLVSPNLELMPFPLRMGFRASDRLEGVPERWIRTFPRKRYGEKRLVDLGFFKQRVSAPAPLRWLLIGRRQDGSRSSIEPITRGEALGALAVHMVAGYGVAQMSEYMLRTTDFFALARIALLRAKTAARLAKDIPCYRFTLGGAPRENIAALSRFLDLCGG